MPKDEYNEALFIIAIYLLSQFAAAFCFYKHAVFAGILAWIVGNTLVVKWVNRWPPDPPVQPPNNTFWGGPHGRY